METVILRILNGTLVPDWAGPDLRYRGVYRDEPTYCDALPADHEINNLFVNWYIEEAGESGIVHDLDKAVRYTGLCNKHFPGRFFEVIAVTEGDSPPKVGGRFLGFDLSQGGASSILQGGHQSWIIERQPKRPADVLWKVMRLYFGPRLNEFGLFQRIEDASLCLDSMVALQGYSPGYFEGGDLNVFHVMGVYLVWGQDHWPPVAGGEARWQPGADPRGGSSRPASAQR